MPKLGEIRPAKHIDGFRDAWTKYIWTACPDCGKERWVQYVKGKPINEMCSSCWPKHLDTRWDKNPAWRGGRCQLKDGYVRVRVKPDDFFYPMATDGYVMEHRLVVAEHLKRCLLSWEIVHHKNGVRNDNRFENLQLLPTARYHLPDTLMKAKVKRLEATIKQQTEELKQLRERYGSN